LHHEQKDQNGEKHTEEAADTTALNRFRYVIFTEASRAGGVGGVPPTHCAAEKEEHQSDASVQKR